MIAVKQIQKTSYTRRQNGLYLVFKDDIMVGMIERPYHTKQYRAQTKGETFELCSTKQLAITAFENKF